MVIEALIRRDNAMKRVAAFALLATVTLASCDSDDTVSDVTKSGTDPLAYQLAVAETFAPLLVFDQKQGEKEHRCFPMDAGVYYDVRRKGYPYWPDCEPTCIIENMDYVPVFLGRIPTYYQYAACNGAEYVMYWWFYGYQPDCDGTSGEHPADWERICVKVVDGELNRVLFFQHGGQYTLFADNPDLELHDDRRPVVYVGAQQHGSYHDTGGIGGCCYFEDYRNPGPSGQWKEMHTWENLVRLSLDEDSPEWMKCWGPECWDGITSPLRRGSLCNLPGCVGEYECVAGEAGGCTRGDINFSGIIF